MQSGFIGLLFSMSVFLLLPGNALWSQDPVENIRPTVALVLEGGGSLGFAHIGVIKVIEEIGIPIDLIVGTSMGATVGGLYALGYDATRLKEISLGVDWDAVFSEQMTSIDERYLERIDTSSYVMSVDFDRQGFKVPSSLLSGRKMLYYLDRFTMELVAPTNFDELPRRFRAVAADIATGERVVIGHGSLADALRASMGVPGMLAPYHIEDRYLVDGAVVDNLAVDVARDLGADLIIAVNLARNTPFEPELLNRNPLETLIRAVDIMIRSNVLRQSHDADLVVTVDVQNYDSDNYQNAIKMIALGTEAAEKMHADLEEFKSKLGTLSDYTANLHQTDQTPILKIEIEGGNRQDQERARSLFSPLEGNILAASDIEDAVAALEARGSYEYIRLQRTINDSVPTLTVSLQRKAKPGHSLRLGIDYSSTYSGSSLNSTDFALSLVFRSLITENSRLTMNALIPDSPTLELIMLQPIGGEAFIEGFIMARQETEAFLYTSSSIVLQQTGIIETGINLGISPVLWAEIVTGVRYQLTQGAQNPIITAGEASGSALIGTVFLSAYQLDSPIFPSNGFSIFARYDQSLIRSGSSSVFRILCSEALYIPDFDVPLSFALWGIAGTDFSTTADSTGAAPRQHKPRLSNRQFFPGPLKIEEQIGSHIAGIGTHIKYQLIEASAATGIPFYLLLQASQGTVLPDADNMSRILDFTHWTGSLGLGSRLNDGFGVLLRVGATYSFDGKMHPFIAFDLGSLGNRRDFR